jgi:flagellar biosynthetic protein FliR
MTITVNFGWLLATLLLSMRIAGAMAFAPVLGPAQIPAVAKVILVLGLSAMLVPFAPAVEVVKPEIVPIVVAAFGELLLGAAFAFGFIAAYGATQVAGRVLDIQMGFGAASILNPTTQGVAPLIGSVFGIVAVAAFLSLDGHHVLIQALALSMEAIPPGGSLMQLDPADFLRHSAMTFSFGLALAAPVMFSLLLADIAMAIAARSMPQLNVFTLGFAIKIMLGVAGLALSARFAEALFATMFDRVFRFWEGLAGG